MERAGADWPQMYKVWITKQVAGCCGTNKMLSYWDTNVKSKCNYCDKVEDSMHITRCQDPTRIKLQATAKKIAG